MTTSEVRTALFVPATRPERIQKAIASGADRVIVDLEDAVEETLKESARQNLEAFLTEQPKSQVLVRVNAPGHWSHLADLDVCRRHAGVIGVVLPKAETEEQIANTALTGKPIWPIIESAKGLSNVDKLASCYGVERLLFGSLDLGVDLHLAADTDSANQMLSHARYAVLLANRVAGLDSALDGVYPAFRDTAGLRKALEAARNMGFGGALCIHPSQVDVIHDTLKPNQTDLDWAKKIIEGAESGEGVFVLEGQMVDAPVISRARAILARLA